MATKRSIFEEVGAGGPAPAPSGGAVAPGRRRTGVVLFDAHARLGAGVRGEQE